ncbi:4-(cytidine 5'-diphospho)-2-C-methyl-D-erythritol kinase [Flavisolibacter sp. BT320]|nr:4-(cytidine 5'-diphospho)-2-C-methyl-D-erythritol kinase [Flavisolibacter longurius]
MILFPNCKINLGLHILRKREDGYHDLQTIFYPFPLKDALEVVRHPSPPVTDVEYSGSGLQVQGDLSNNICIKAYHLLKQDFPDLAPVKMHLHKTIPMGAGLGGGSADGAFTLLLLNQKFNLGLSEEALLQYALQLGSDCPFFIRNQPSFATGRGEILEPISLDLSGYQFVVVNPGIHVNTGWAFSQIRPMAERPSLKEIVQKPVETWKESLSNDFESPVSRQHPQIGRIKNLLSEQGAVYAAMTGSGSTVFGIFSKEAKPELDFPPSYFVRIV